MLVFSHKKKCLKDVLAHLASSFFLVSFQIEVFLLATKKCCFLQSNFVDVAVNVAQIFTKSCQTQHIETNDDDTRNEQKEEIFCFSTDLIESV